MGALELAAEALKVDAGSRAIGPVTFKRNYHYCEDCKYGFYPVDRHSLRDEGEARGRP